MAKKITFKSDKFKKNRGGYSRWLLLSCEKCANPLLLYQKDGPGILKRLYLDRITAPNIGSGNLICKKCKTLLGIPITYKKEDRPAIRLFAGAINKKIVNPNRLSKFNF